MRLRPVCLALALVLGACTATPDRQTAPEPAGFWTGEMGGPVPATIAGGTVIDTAALAELIAEEDPVLIDVGPDAAQARQHRRRRLGAAAASDDPGQRVAAGAPARAISRRRAMSGSAAGCKR